MKSMKNYTPMTYKLLGAATVSISGSELINHYIRVLRPDFRGIFLVVAAHVAGAMGDGVAVFVEADGDVDLAGEGHALHHDVLLAQAVVQRESRVIDFFDGEGRAAGASSGAGDDE